VPITVDPANKRLILDSASVTAQEIYAAWVDWVALSDNAKYLPAFSSVGGDELGGGLFIPPYYFLLNGWRVRPMEANHTLIITGNLVVQGGGVPVVPTLGTFNVSVQYTVPVQAQGISTSGGGGATAAQVWQQTIESGLSAEQMLRIMLAALSGQTSGIGTAVESYNAVDNSKPRLTATFDAQGNRTGVVLDGS
jgi:hypothetical protein